MSEIPVEATEKLIEASAAHFTRREQGLVILGALVAFALFWLAGHQFKIPTERHFSASLFQQPTAFTTIVVVGIVYAASVVIGSFIAGVIGFDAGLFCASIGLCALSARGGAMRFTLMESPTAATWLMLIGEIIVLALVVGCGMLLQDLLHRKGLLHDDDHRHIVNEVHRSLDQRLLALLCNVIVISICMMLLAPTDRKPQAVITVAVSSFLGTLAAYYIVPTKPSVWYWAAPIVVGAIGYGLQYIAKPGGWEIGEIRGAFAALARPLPLDYAGSGVAAAIFGYWVSRRWQHEREISTVTGETTS